MKNTTRKQPASRHKPGRSHPPFSPLPHAGTREKSLKLAAAPSDNRPARNLTRLRPLTARVGLLAVGHHTYWPQFPGLLEEMRRKIGVLAGRLQTSGVQVENFGLVDDAQAAWAALPRVKGADLDLLFVDMATYATSSTFGVICREVNVPIVLVALQPMAAMDYPNGTTLMQLANDDFCSVPEFAGVAVRFGKPVPHVILGHETDDTQADAELARWGDIAKVLHSLRKGRIGLMGHVLESMYDMHADPAAITAAFGCHVPLLEPHDLMRHYQRADRAAIEEKKKTILDFFDTPDPKSDPITEKLTEGDLEIAAKAAVALDGLIAEKDLTGLAYYYEADPGSEMRTLVTNLIVGNSLLTGGGFPMCGEYDLKNCIAMLIFDRLGIGGSFAEFHPVDFAQDTVLVGHDGPHHINIADGQPVLRSLKKYHGKPGSGASVEFQLKEGPITMMSIGQTADGKFKFIVAEGMSERRPIPPTGNTNTHGRFGKNVRKFLCDWVKEGPTHHFALGIGHHADTLVKVAACLGIEAAVVRRQED
jgi:L-arabinose isomerase